MFEYTKPEKKQKTESIIQKKASGKASSSITGIPDTTKRKFESRSGVSLDDVRVHYNSDKPKQLQALAYTQGNQVYLGPGQEKQLEHELGHVVQQKQGRLGQAGGIVQDAELEYEADHQIIHPSPMPVDPLPKAFNCSVIQKKSGIPLGPRLEKLKSLTESEKALIAAYDSLADEESTREEQKSLLVDIMKELMSQDSPSEQAMQVVKDEAAICETQDYSLRQKITGDPYSHMDDSPLIRALLTLLPQDLSTASISGTVPNLAKIVLSRFSTRQVNDLYGMDENKKLTKEIIDKIKENYVLSHYSHTDQLSVLHSTDSLKSMGMIKDIMKEGEQDSLTKDTRFISKSQDVDVDYFKNTGFVFFFLERKGANFRNTRFGKYRYSVPADTSILHNAWAILHDLAGFHSATSRQIKTGIKAGSDEIEIKRSVTMDIDNNKLMDIMMNKKLPQEVRTVCSMITPGSKKTTTFTTDDKREEKFTEPRLEHGILKGNDIIMGIAHRVSIEIQHIKKLMPDASPD